MRRIEFWGRDDVNVGRPRFSSAAISITDAAEIFLRSAERATDELLVRHYQADWGDVTDEDCRFNDLNLERRSDVKSIFTISGQEVWVWTYLEPGETTIMLPSDY